MSKENQYEADEQPRRSHTSVYAGVNSSGVPSIFLYMGGLIAVNVVLVLIDAPFFIY